MNSWLLLCLLLAFLVPYSVVQYQLFTILNTGSTVSIFFHYILYCLESKYIKFVVILLFQVISDESKKDPLVVLIKDVEKSTTGSSESYVTLKYKFEALPPGVLIVGSHTQADNRKEKVLKTCKVIY